MGTLVECEIVQAQGEQCEIVYWCPQSLEFVNQWVNRGSIIFPQFCEYGAM